MVTEVHPEMTVLVEAKKALHEATTVDAQRQAFARYIAVTQRPYPADMQVEDLIFPGPESGQGIPVRWYRPAVAPVPSPVVLYFHGGGFTLGDLDSSDTQAWGIAQQTGDGEGARFMLVEAEYTQYDSNRTFTVHQQGGCCNACDEGKSCVECSTESVVMSHGLIS
mgnify:CR=1 FL=1